MKNYNELYHYGVPGMRWGHRKEARITKRAKKQGWSDDATETAKIRIKKVNQMSNKELKTVNERRNLEQNYRNLNPNAIKKGIAIAGTTVAALGTVAALYKHGKTIVAGGKKVLERYKKVKASAVSKAFWKDMRKVSTMGSDFSSLLK